MDEKEARYANAQEARGSGAVTRGWIPDVLPDDAVEIRELHNIDTNRTWGCFKTVEGLQHVRDRLEALGAKRVSVPLAPTDEDPPSWWPQNAAEASEEVHQLQEGRGMILRVGIIATKEVCFYRGVS